MSNVMLANALASMTENTRLLSELSGAQDILTSALSAGGRDPADYAEGISYGISQALCLGRGNRGVKMNLEGESERGVKDESGGVSERKTKRYSYP